MYYIQQYLQFASQKVMWICNVLLPLFKFNWKEVFIMSRKILKIKQIKTFICYIKHYLLMKNIKIK